MAATPTDKSGGFFELILGRWRFQSIRYRLTLTANHRAASKYQFGNPSQYNTNLMRVGPLPGNIEKGRDCQAR